MAGTEGEARSTCHEKAHQFRSPMRAADRAETLDDLTEPQEVDSEAWFPEDRDWQGFKAMEESVELGDLDITLSIVTVVE